MQQGCSSGAFTLCMAFSNKTIREAVKLWVSDKPKAKAAHGHIKQWDASEVTDMDWLFEDCCHFNDDISMDDVSNIASMERMFCGASSFNQNISGWDVSNVASMERMFLCASSFNQNISAWDVSNVTSMEGMFCAAASFRQKLSWDTQGKNTFQMFYDSRGSIDGE